MKYTSHEIIEILKAVNEVGYHRFHLESKDFLLEVDMDTGNSGASSGTVGGRLDKAPIQVAATETISRPQQTQSEVKAEIKKESGIAVLAPMSGTFYSAPSPEKPPFVEIGSIVKADDVVCVIEVMKLFNSIPAGVAGKVVGVSAKNEDSVSLDQPLIWIEPGQ